MEKIIIQFQNGFPGWLALTYVAVAVAMAVDFVAGVRKARRAGIAVRSRGYKRTCDKATKYFLPMVCLTCVDAIISIILPAPLLTMAMGAFNIFCEWKSVLETTHDKTEINRMANTVTAIIENRDDVAAAIARSIKDSLTDDAAQD